MTLLTLIRPATLRDADHLLLWRNQPESVRWSRTGAVDPDQHARWLTGKLNDPTCQVMIGEVQHGMPVGMVRVEGRGGYGWVSVCVASGWHRDGIGWQLVDWARAQSGPLRVEIHRDNLISRRLFVSHGFVRQAVEDGDWLCYEVRR